MPIQSTSMSPEAGRWYKTRLVAQDAVQNVIQNPTGKPCLVLDAVVHVITGASGVTVDLGTNATSETTSDNLIDGGSVATNSTQINNEENKGSNGKGMQLLAATSYVTADLSGAASGLVADVYLYLKELQAS